MLFNTLAYAGFFAVVYVVSWLLSRLTRLRLYFLLGASYYFYAHWDLRFLPLIWLSSTVDFYLARAIARAKSQSARRAWLGITVVLNLGLLGFFKYYHFGYELVATLAGQLGHTLPVSSLEVALPVGISFFTFESMSYVIDVYRRELEPHSSYFEYLSFVAFFPHLVAGPIVRPRDLLPQLAQRAHFDLSKLGPGLLLITLGLGKKIVIGDTLALQLVDRVFDAPAFYSALENYAAILGYTLQIYCDFSGYTDIAIGSALLLGVEFPKNFDSPYKSQNITEFWRRWHISLSTWLRDYLYIPLGGNRKGRLRTYINLVLTMLLGGLWHGANWTFVVWGGLHGLGLAFHKAVFGGKLPQAAPVELSRGARVRRGLLAGLSTLLTFHFVALAWVFFRAKSFSGASAVFARLGSLTSYHPNLNPLALGALGLGLGFHFLPDSLDQRLRAKLLELPGPVLGLLLFGVLWLYRQLSSQTSVPFVYFQF